MSDHSLNKTVYYFGEFCLSHNYIIIHQYSTTFLNKVYEALGRWPATDTPDLSDCK